MFRLLLLDSNGKPMVSRPLSSTPTYVGRAPTNDLVIDDGNVSSRHAAFWAVGDRVFVEDLGSRNGTFAGDRRIRKVAEVGDDLELRLGGTIRMRIEPDADAAEYGPVLLLEDVTHGVWFPVRGDRFHLGGSPDADVRIEGQDGDHVLRIDDTGEAVLERSDGSVDAVRHGIPFLVGERTFRLRAPPTSVSLTGGPLISSRCVLRVEIDGATGPHAELRDEATGLSQTWTAGNRVSLLYVLARRFDDDRKSGVADRGWCTDAEVALGVWGREGEGRNLNVLVTRIRNDLRRAGLDPWLIEKRPGFVRLHRVEVEVLR